MKFVFVMCSIVCYCILLPAGNAVAQEASLSPHGDFDLQIDCASCHRTEGWSPVLDELQFNHDKQTRFALTGSHVEARCISCHLENRFDQPLASATECTVCHIDVHQGAFSENCVDCHNTSLFQEVEGIGLHTQTNFPLTGAHAQLTCTSCHTDDAHGAFTPLETACVDCHQEDYNTSILVDHQAAGFPLECESCHTDLQWQGALFEHLVASNGFDLVGSHQGLACASCHQSPNLATIFQPANDQDCFTCHVDDYEDEHGGGFPTTCIDCHNQNDWEDVEEIDHLAISGGFELIGAHQNVSCGSCHNTPDYTLLFQPDDNQDCISCHRDDYDDEHGAGFPITCLDCHNQNDWDDTHFNHDQDYFPIFSGNHRNAWDRRNCLTCHIQPDDLSIFSCQGACHEHTEAKMNNEHRGIAGYVFESKACLSCHPDGDD